MKRFYKFLMPLVAIVAMALPVNVVAQDSCTVKIIGEDSYGDGWNGGSLAIMQGTTQVATFTLSDGDDLDSITVTVADAPVSFVWTSGSYDSEVSFEIYHSSGVLIYSASTPSAGTVFSLASPCSACFAPGGVAVDSLTSDAARIVWNGTATSYGYLWGTAVDVAEGNGSLSSTTDNYLELNALTSGTGYTVMVWSDCDGETSDTVSITFATIGDAVSEFPYSTGFEPIDDIAWSYVNNSTNKWFIGTGAAQAGTSALYITNDNGTSNSYTNNATQFSYAYRVFSIEDSAQYYIGFNWKANGESNYDYLRAWLAPASAVSSLTAGQDPEGGTSAYNYRESTPAGWIDLGGKMNQKTSWQGVTQTANLSEGSYALIFMWANDASGGSQPPAAIDNVIFGALSCGAPTDVAVNSANADTVIVTWSGADNANYQVAVGLSGFSPDAVSSDSLILATDTIAYLTDLEGGVSYDLYVRTDCGDDQSFWVGPIQFSPGQILMGVTGSASMNVCGAIIYDDGGPAGEYSNNAHYTLTLYPTDDTKRFKFWGSGVTEGTIDYLRVYAGTAASGTLLGQINNSNPTIDTVITQGGPITLLFHSDGSIVYAGFELHVQCIDMALCRDIEEVSVEGVSTSSAYVTWRNAVGTTPEADNYIVTVTDSTETVVTSVTVSDMYAMVGGLQPNTDYTVSVVPACDEGNGSPAAATFTTAGFGCLQVDASQAFSDTIGNGTNTSTSLPSYSFYNYGLTQQIFTASEIGHGGQIDNFSFMMSAVTQQRTYEIYMGHTPNATASDFIHPDDLTLVYNGGPVTMTEDQWTTFTLTTPFNYNGTDNLVIILRDMTGSYVSGNNGYVHSAASGAARYAYQDSGPYDPFTYSGGTTLSVRNNIILGGAPCAVQATCAAPLVVSNVVDAETVTLMWAAGASETSWTVQHMASTDADWTTDLPSTTTTSYTFENLTPNSLYLFRVYHICGTDTFATVCTARTDCVGMTVPFSENFSTWATGTSAPMPSACWFKGSDYNPNYPYVTTGNSMPGDNNSMYFYASGTTLTYLALPKFEAPIDTLVVSGYIKYSSNGYMLNVGVMTDPTNGTTFQPISSVSTVANQWVPFEVSFAGVADGYIAFATGNGGSYSYLYLDNIEVNYYNSCIRPTNVNDRNTTLNTATIYWTDTVTTDFVVEYGPVGFAHGTGTTVSVSGVDTVQLTGLNHSSRYDVYVRGICGGDSSNWSFVHQFNTECGTIDALPFTENFESWGTGSNVHAPMCWTYGSDYSTTYPYISTNTTQGGVMYLYDYDYNHNGYKTWFALPELASTLGPANQMEVIFNTYTSTSSYVHPVMVGVGDNPTMDSTVVWLDTVMATYNVWEEHEISFDNYTGTGRYVFFATYVDPAYSYSYPYIDDITLEMIPSCRRPDNLYAANATTTTVDLGWNERSGATTWIVEYGPTGFELGTGTTVVATSNPFTLTGLPVAYQGEYYVRSLCGAGDTGDYSRHPQGFATSQIPATLPYNYDFENGAEWANWQVSSNNPNVSWYRGTAVADSSTHSIYVSADSGATYKPYLYNAVTNVAAYRDIDFGPIDSSYTLSFRARVGGTIDYNYDGLMVFLVDPSLPTTPSDAGITSPWGNVNDLYRIASIRRDTTWQTYEASFDTIHGIHRVAFFWFNQSTASTPNLGEPAAVDNIHIDYSSCPRPVAVEAVTATANTAVLNWVGSPTANYEVTYRQVGGTNQVAYTNTNSIVLTGLTSAAEYRVWVRKLCGAGDTSLYSDAASFETGLCDGAIVVSTEDASATTGTSYNAPVNNYYNYTLSETIIDSAELGGPMEISTIAYYYNYTTASTSKSSVNIWIQPTSKTAFSSSSDLDVLDSSVAVMVYSGNLNCSQGWNYFAFTTNYQYNGVGNLMVIVDDNSGDYDGSSYVFKTVPTTDYKTLTYYSDTYNPDPTSTSPDGSSSYYMWRPMMQLISCGAATCEAPYIDTVYAGENDVTLQWTGYAAGYEVAVVEGTWNNPTAGTPVTNSSYTFTGLTPATQYAVGVRAVCSEDLISEWTVTMVTTTEHPCYAPTNLAATNPTFNGATLAWTAAEADQTNFEIRVSAAGDTSIIEVSQNPYTLTGLLDNTEYTAAVRAICGENNYSDWSAPVTFRTATCQTVTGVNVTNVTSSSATVSWTSNGSSSYQLAYGDVGTTIDNCQIVNVNGTSYTLTGLEDFNAYVVYVRAICAEGVYSDWSNAVTFTTETQGIEDVDNAAISLYPNPASSTVTLTGIEGEAMVTVVDMNGRQVYTQAINQSGNQTITIDVSGMSQGAYFVRITGERVNAIRKLIVR